jgi:hypothetical protein
LFDEIIGKGERKARVCEVELARLFIIFYSESCVVFFVCDNDVVIVMWWIYYIACLNRLVVVCELGGNFGIEIVIKRRRQ